METDARFLVVAKSIALNMAILKHQLKATYDTLPWEELEFCLITYITSRLHPQEKSILPLVAITKETLLSQFGYFTAILKKLCLDDLPRPNEFPDKSKDEVVSKIKKNATEFVLLYEIYQKVRDVYSLEKIEEYLEASLSVNHKDKSGQLAIIRTLQVLSDHLKNNFSWKLSDETSRIILSALPTNTRNIVINLRNAVSHTDSLKQRLEIEEKTQDFFCEAQKDLRRLSQYVVSGILNIEKLRIIVELLEKIAKCDNNVDVNELGKSIKFVQKCIDVKNIRLFDEEEVQKWIHELNLAIPEQAMGEREGELINRVMNSSLWNDDDSNLPPPMLAVLGANALHCFEKFEFDKKLDAGEVSYFKSAAIVALHALSPKNHAEILSKLLEFVQVFGKTIKRKYNCFSFSKLDVEKINMLLFDISFAASKKVEDVQCQDFTQDVVDSFESTKQSGTGLKEYLKPKLSVLKSLIGSEKKNADFLKESKESRLATEILLLDIFSILDGNKCGTDKNNLDDNCPPLHIGKCFMNYLANESILIDIFSKDLATTTLSIAHLLINHELSLEEYEIGKLCCHYEVLSEAKVKLNEGIEIVTSQDKLFRALENGNTEKSLALIKSGADVFGRSANNESSLHFAARSQNIDLPKFILEENVKDSTDKEGLTVLHVAATHGNVALVQHLKVNGSDLEQKDKKGQTCLHLAAKHGQTEMVALLLKLGADFLSITHKNTVSPRSFGAGNGNECIEDTFIERGVHLFGCGTIGQLTPLHVAAEYNRVDIIKLMLKNGVDVDIPNDMNGTPLIIATENGCVKSVEVLIKAGANVNACFDRMFTPLHFTADRGHTALAAVLLQNGAQADPENSPDKPIHYAAMNGHSEMVKLLIQHKANFNRRSSWGSAPIHLAAQIGHTKVVQTLLEAGVHVNCRDMNGRTTLHCAAAKGRLEVAKLLIEKGAELNAKGPLQETPLSLAATGGYYEMGEMLVNSGAKINVKRDVDGCTPLHLVAREKGNMLFRLFLERGANTEVKNARHMTALHFASTLGNVDGVSHLIRFKSNVNARGMNGITPLHMAAAVGSCEVAELLLKNGANVNLRTTDNDATPLFTAVEHDRFEMAQLLVRYGADVNLSETPPVIKAIDNNSIEILEYLVKRGVNARKEDVLFKAVCMGLTDCVRVLLENGFPPDSWSGNGCGLLHVAAARGFKNIVCELLDHGAKINSIDGDMLTSLHYAVRLNFYEVVEVLLSRGATVHAQDNEGRTPLHMAASFGDLRIMELLLENGADPLVEDKGRDTPLSISIQMGDLEKVKALFKTERVNTMTPMHLSGMQSYDLFMYLVRSGPLSNLVDHELKPIHVACSAGKQDIVEYFLNLGVSVNETSGGDMTCLHYAAFMDNLPLIKYLVSRGANVNVKDKMKNTPLIIARDNGAIVKFLFENGAYFDEKMKLDGASKAYLDVVNLLTAVKENHVTEVTKYIKMGTCLNAISSSSATPLHFASCKGYYEIVKLLLEYNAIVNVSASKAYTPLHYAAIYSHEDVVLELLSHGAVYNALTDGGSTPLSLATDRNIVELLSLIEKCFDQVEKGDMIVESIIQEEFVENKRRLEALMKTRNRNMQDIFDVADKHKYPKTNNLYEICHADFIATNLRESQNTGIDEETLVNIKSELKKKQEWLIRKNTSSASSVLQQISDLLKDVEKNEAAKLIRSASGKQGDVIVAALKGDLDHLKMAIQRGCTVNETDSHGRTAIHYAVDRDDEKCVRFLLQSGADVTHVSHKGNTALHTAVNNQSAPMVKILLEFALNNRKLDFINKPTLAKGNTALHVAAKNGNLDVLKILLKFGATYEIKNLDGATLQNLSSNVEVVRFFELLSQMFDDAKTGNFRLIKQMKSLKKEDVSAIAGARNLAGRTILQVAIGCGQKNISSNLLKIIQAANAK